VAGVARLTPRFLAQLEGLWGDRRLEGASEAVGATIAALTEAETLPGLLDVVGEMPPTEQALVRRVAGYNLWLWYRVKNR
jgi:hypothetical protein